MALGRKNPSDRENPSGHEAVVASGDGFATLRLREAEKATSVNRRGVLWRAGLATVASAAALTALGQRRADAASGGNFILGQSNNAGTTTTLTPTANLYPMMKFDGSGMTASAFTVEIDSPTAGGVGLKVNQAGTVGLAISVTATGASNAIEASSDTGTGVKASSTSGTALSVNGKTYFSRSGAAKVPQASKAKVVKVSGMTATSLVLVTLQTSITGIYVAAAVPAAGEFTVHLNNNTPVAAKFAWFVLN